MGESEGHLGCSWLCAPAKNGGIKMVKGIGNKDQVLLLISNHKILSGISACIQCMLLKMGFNKRYSQMIEDAMETFLEKEKIKSGGTTRIYWDILYSRFRYMIGPEEYFLYDFRSRNAYGRKDFVGEGRMFLFWRKLWDEKTCEIYSNKFLTYQTYRKYYGREVVHISSDSDFSEFYSFTKRHSRFIVKPLNKYGGSGIHIAGAAGQEEALAIFNEIRAVGAAVVEELVTQAPEMAKFNPSSVNTIRLVTFYHKERLTRICAVLRMGRNGSEVDNATFGGIYAPIDMAEGFIYTYAGSFQGEKYAVHPDTGVQIVGAKIPKWHELNTLMEELVKVVPQQKLIGWDMALTPSGWIMIEANHDPCCQNLVCDHGLREVMHDFYEAFYE